MAELLFLGTGAANYKLEEKCDGFRRNSSVLIDRYHILNKKKANSYAECC